MQRENLEDQNVKIERELRRKVGEEKAQLTGSNLGPLAPKSETVPLELPQRPSCAKVGTLETPLCYADRYDDNLGGSFSTYF